MTKTNGLHVPGDRYVYDFSVCTPHFGWAQVDTSQDAPYFGQWANPHQRKTVCYCEGDLTVIAYDTDEDFAAALREIKAWNERQGHEFLGIDCMCREEIKRAFEAIGLGDLLHQPKRRTSWNC